MWKWSLNLVAQFAPGTYALMDGRQRPSFRATGRRRALLLAGGQR